MQLDGAQDNLRIIRLLLTSPALQPGVKNRLGNTALHLAAQNGKHAMINTMADVFSRLSKEKNSDGKTALHLAAENGHNRAVQALLQYEGREELAAVADDDGNTALHRAAMVKNVDNNDVLDSLLSAAPALLNRQNDLGRTPLHLAVRIGNEYAVELFLLKSDIQVNRPDRDGNTALHLAALNGKTEIVRLLLNKNETDPTITNNDDLTARDLAVNNDHTAVIAVFDGGETLRGTTSGQRLLQAMRVGNLDPADCAQGGNMDSPEDLADCRRNTALALIRAGDNLNVNYQDTTTGDTALHYAAKGQGGDTQETYELIADLLLRHTLINPNLRNVRGETPLHLAVKYGDSEEDSEIVRLLLRHFELNVNLPVDGRCETRICGYTALHMAVDLEYGAIVEQLLSYRLGTIDVNETNDAGYAPLHIAAEQRDDDMTQILVGDRRVDVNVRTRFGEETALHIAARYGDVGSTAPADPPDPDNPAAPDDEESSSIVATLLKEADLDVNAQNRAGETALHIAAHRGHLEVVNQLFEDGRIDARIRDNKQRTAYSRGERYPAIANAFKDKKYDDDNLLSGTLMEILRGKGDKNVEAIAIRLLEDDEDDLDVNEKDRKSGKTPLHYAVEYNYGDLIDQLLQRTDIRVNLKTKTGETPLFTAVRLAEGGATSKLLAHLKTQVNEKDNKGSTALLTAIKAKELAIAQALLAHKGIDVNLTDRAGNSALLLAVSSKQSSLVTALLAFNDINVDIKNTAGKASLHIAVENNDEATVAALLQNGRIDPNLAESSTREKNTPLHIAVKQHLSSGQSHIRVILLLLGHERIRPNIKNSMQDSPLMVAVKEESGTLVSNLLQYTNVDVDTANSRRKTALMFAAERGSESIVNRLVARGASVNLQDDKKFTALHYAAHQGNVEAARILLQVSGIDITLADKWGLTARERAAIRGHDAVVKLFDTRRVEQERIASAVSILAELARGDTEDSIMTIVEGGNIKVNALDTDNRNYTALHYAANLGYERVVRALLEYDDVRANAADTSGQTALHLATARNRLAVVQALLAHSGTNAAAKTNKGFTALHWSAQLGYTDIARALLAADDNLVNQQTNRKRTALHYASVLGQRAIVNLLLQQDGVNLDYVDDNRDTALHYAAAQNRLTIAESLLEAGASTGIANKQYKTARSIAWDNGYAQMVQLIDRYRN